MDNGSDYSNLRVADAGRADIRQCDFVGVNLSMFWTEGIRSDVVGTTVLMVIELYVFVINICCE